MRRYDATTVLQFSALEKAGRAHRADHSGLIDEALAAQTLGNRALMIYTSGSTGKPKGAILTYRNLRAEAIAVIDRLALKPNTTHLSYLPLCHVAEQFCTTMVAIYLGSQINFGESIRTVQEDLREVAPRMFLGVPRIREKLHSAIHIRMLETGGLRKRLYDWAIRTCDPVAEQPWRGLTLAQKATYALAYVLVFRALQNFIGLTRARVGMTGAAPISPRIVRYFRTIGVPLVEVYGATETSGMVLGQTRGKLVEGSVDTPVCNAEVRIGEDGELLVRSDLVFEGYYCNPEATAATIRSGWLHTGDVAEVDADGQYRTVDRLKDIMITVGGKNLSPSEIENTVKGSPFVKECITIGERRKYVAALIQIEYETVGKWAEERGIAYTNFRNLSENPAVRELIGAEIDAANAQLAQISRIRRFHLLTKELDHDDDDEVAAPTSRPSTPPRSRHCIPPHEPRLSGIGEAASCRGRAIRHYEEWQFAGERRGTAARRAGRSRSATAWTICAYLPEGCAPSKPSTSS
jgi:long-chain acyl-CoA synthetase